jgi:phenylalanyl-tRNA synthetase beta chain
MKISEQWLREWANPRLDTKTLAERLTMAGLEVGAVTPAAEPLEQVVVGEIRAISAHPQADRLRVCEVAIGKGRTATIVCGAANAAVGMKAPVALPGAKLPNGTAIQETNVRGVQSAGMLCSAQELGLEEKSDGLLDLGSEVKPGAGISDVLGLDDNVFEVDLTPNRGDCLSARGIAREISAITGTKLLGPRLRPVKTKSRRRIDVKLEAAADCPQYVGRVIENIDPNAVTPLWMRERLRRAGQRLIHPVVDVTNYVMFELGQPMHAFDIDKLNGGILVRRAKGKESLTLLDDSTIEVEQGTLLIADSRGPVALAGIMGGKDSAVGPTTKHVFFESAFFSPEIIAGRARALGKQSESSHRFERGVDPALQATALERATELLLAIAGGKAGPIVARTAKNHLPKVKPILLRSARSERMLGLALPSATAFGILSRLGMRVSRAGRDLRVTPPTWRFDVRREVDLIEELARIVGYDKIPSKRPRIEMAAPAVTETQVGESRLRSTMVDREYQEVVTYSFVDPKLQNLLDPQTTPLALANPISADMGVMRTTLWPGLVQAVLYNQNRQQTRLRFFEIGRRFVPSGTALAQERCLSGAVTGTAYAEQWGAPKRDVDFHDIRADIEALFTLSGRRGELQFIPTQHPALHPGQSADVMVAGKRAGILGTLHPEIQAKLGLDRKMLLFEIALAALTDAKIPMFREVSKFPGTRRDISLDLSEEIPAEKVLKRTEEVAGNLLVNLELFDEYRGKGIDSGRKSLSLGLTLQDSSRTLKETEVDAVVSEVIAALQTELGARLRSQ